MGAGEQHYNLRGAGKFQTTVQVLGVWQFLVKASDRRISGQAASMPAALKACICGLDLYGEIHSPKLTWKPI